MAFSIQPVPVMRPKLPIADRIVPYLRQIDATRTYSNFGPLVQALEARFAKRWQITSDEVITVANATLGLALALAAQNPPRGSLCAMPAWTFAASAHAAMLAGLVPYFVDVAPDTWMLHPNAMEAEITRAPQAIGAVMPVAPFGQPIDIAVWDDFRARTGLAVVVDAAAGFDSLIPGATPAVVSLHATKVLGVGEGGLVVSSDPDLIRDLRARSNFGFYTARQAKMPATNAKLSEYHAAIGHAALDEWDLARAEWLAAAQSYRDLFAESNWTGLQVGFGQSWVTSTCVLSTGDVDSDHVERALAAAQIETRKWWWRGAHAHPATENFPRTALPVTERLARTTIGMPFYRDLEFSVIERIAECVQLAGPERS